MGNYNGNWSGTDAPFIGIDDAALGDGQADTLPADTWLQNRFRGNTLFLAQEPREVGYSPRIENADDTGTLTGIRVCGAYTDFVSVLYCSHPQTSKLATIAIRGAVNVQSWGATSSNGTVTLKLQFGSSVAYKTLSNTNGSWTSFEITVSAPVQVSDRGWLPLRLYVRANDANESRAGTETVEASQGRFVPIDGSGNPNTGSSFFDESGSAHPNSSGLNNQYLEVTDNGYQNNADDPVDAFDMLGNIESQYGVSSHNGMVCYPEADYSALRAVEVTRKYMGVAQFRGMCIRAKYRKDSVTTFPQTAIEGKKVFNSAPALRQLQSIRDLYERPRVLAVGPEGVRASGTDFEAFNGRNIPYRWPFVMGDAGSTTLIRQTVKPHGYDGKIILMAHFISVQQRATPKEVYDEVGSIKWDLTLTVDQLDDQTAAAASWGTDTTSLGTDTQTFELDLHPMHWARDEPILKTLQIAAQWDPTKDLNFAHFEGSLWQEDDPLVTTIGMAVDLTYNTEARAAYPVRVKLDADWNETVRYNAAKTYTEAHTRLVLLGFTIWERCTA